MYSEPDYDYDVQSEIRLRENINEGRIVQELHNNEGFKLIMGVLRGEAIEAMEHLKYQDAQETKEVMNLQNIIWRYEGLAKRVKELIFAGVQAEDTITGEYTDG